MMSALEVHLTLAHPLDRLADWLALRGAKYLHIELDRGASPSQPMLSFWLPGPLERARTEVDAIVARLQAEGHAVTRVKLEMAPTAPPVPGGYFEHHVKLLLNREPDAELIALVLAHGAHLSRNARKRRDDGRHERFVTAREVGEREMAATRFRALEAALRHAGHTVLEVESEYCVQDSAIVLDAGWLPERAEV